MWAFFCVYIREKYFLCRCKTDFRSKYPDACHIFMNFKVINTPIKIMFKKHFYFTNHRPAWCFLCLNIHVHFLRSFRSSFTMTKAERKGEWNKKKSFMTGFLKICIFYFSSKFGFLCIAFCLRRSLSSQCAVFWLSK